MSLTTPLQIRGLLVHFAGSVARMTRLDTESGSYDLGTLAEVNGEQVFTVTRPAVGCAPLPGYDPATAEALPSVEVLAEHIANPPINLAAIQASYDAVTEKLLNERAASWGYASMSRATTYVTSTHAQWASEAAALIAHRDAVWLAGYAIATDVLAGNRPVPSLSAYIAELPAMPARP